jgi:hypothetical protein
MFISYNTSTKAIIWIDEREWACRKYSKKLTTPDYWAWIETITDSDGVITYPSEDFTVVECTDEDVQARLVQLDVYVSNTIDTGTVYNIKYYASKRDAEEILDNDGSSHDPKQYVQSHFVGDDTAKDARLLAEKWTAVRRDRDNRLSQTDYLALSDNTLADNMTTYRQALRDVPSQADPDNITWPTKP